MTAMGSSAANGGQPQPQFRSFSGFDRFHQMDMAVERFRRCVLWCGLLRGWVVFVVVYGWMDGLCKHVYMGVCEQP